MTKESKTVAMRKERGTVLVTGSNGTIGDALMRRFDGRFESVVGFDRQAPSAPPGCTYIPVDITSDESVREGLRVLREHHGAHIASVIHLAAYYDFLGEPSEKYEEITVRGTGRLLRGLRDADFQVDQFIFSSTMLVHRPAEPGQFINEDWPIEPTWAYPESKVHTEKLIHDERGTIPAVLLRISGVYDDRCNSIPLAHQMQRIYERQMTRSIYSGSTAHGQSFMHLDDLLDAIALVVERRAKLPAEVPILLGEPEPLTYDELQHTFARLLLGKEMETLEVPGALAPLAKAGAWVMEKLPGADPFIKPWMIDRANDHYPLDITRARTLLGWQPQRSLRDTIPKMVEALKADPAKFYEENKLGEPPAPVKGTSEHAAAGGHIYTCLMHTEVQHEGPGKCPKCGMELVPKDNMAMGHPGHQDHTGMVRQMREKWLWTNFAVISLGVWLISSPFTFGYASPGLIWSDVVSGALLIFFSALALWPRFDFVGRWSVSLVGAWLQFAPLVFWAPTAAVYLNDTLVGVICIVLSILVPMMPGMAHHMEMQKPGPLIPPGWTYNPSSWHQRAPMIGLAFIGWLASRYLAAFQLGYITTIWDPFFGHGTVNVLHSDVSKAFPISDAGLGAAAYTIEMLMGWMGGKERWRSMPWMVFFFFILVVPLGIVSITLIILQPLAVGSWCSVCLFTALVMLLMIPFAVDEVVATGQFLKRSMREGKPLWRTFWVGGTLAEVNEDQRTPKYGAPVSKLAGPMAWGVTAPWNLVASAALGIWLMFSPAVFGTQAGAADSDHLVGALIAAVAVMAMAEVIRAGRFLNILLGAWIIAAPWLLSGAGTTTRWNDVLAGAVVILLSLLRGPVRERYAGWDRFIL